MNIKMREGELVGMKIGCPQTTVRFIIGHNLSPCSSQRSVPTNFDQDGRWVVFYTGQRRAKVVRKHRTPYCVDNDRSITLPLLLLPSAFFPRKTKFHIRPPNATKHCSCRIAIDVGTQFCENESARWKVPIVQTSHSSCILLLCNRNILFFCPGSEWDYVILSLVRSLPQDEIDPEPPAHWIREKLGFITDPHQINVGLTRARCGMCIIGECSSAPATWTPCITNVTLVYWSPSSLVSCQERLRRISYELKVPHPCFICNESTNNTACDKACCVLRPPETNASSCFGSFLTFESEVRKWTLSSENVAHHGYNKGVQSSGCSLEKGREGEGKSLFCTCQSLSANTDVMIGRVDTLSLMRTNAAVTTLIVGLTDKYPLPGWDDG